MTLFLFFFKHRCTEINHQNGISHIDLQNHTHINIKDNCMTFPTLFFCRSNWELKPKKKLQPHHTRNEHLPQKKITKTHSNPPASRCTLDQNVQLRLCLRCTNFTSNDHVMCRDAGSHRTKMLKEKPLCHCLFAIFTSLCIALPKKRQFAASVFVGDVMWNATSLAKTPCLVFHSVLFSAAVCLPARLSLIKQNRSVPFWTPSASRVHKKQKVEGRNIHTVSHHRASSAGMKTANQPVSI